MESVLSWGHRECKLGAQMSKGRSPEVLGVIERIRQDSIAVIALFHMK